ncbi:Oidioi.mRNA.OKI2018_I69.chr1.g2923.t1.cds [Oikopleura dioica]|uniref:ER membrane protein complex subunit 4 n=1 Tax=Oikopleura dioica TaxID=34765 RepID=A0ABN7T1R5_OIKDI|nr:Oidioi.mRNA.OKI2018_I69.chr1.g2923.t1.cds [Oikopleura dioica]
MTVPDVTAGQEKSPRSPILVKKEIIWSSSQGCRKMKMPVESTCSLDSDYDIEERPLFNDNPEPSGATEMLQEVLNMSTEGDLLEDIPSEEIFSFLERREIEMEVQKRKMASKWIIDTPSPRERELPAPVGFSRERMALAQAQANQKNGPDQALLDKRNWDIALKNFKSLPMTLFMFYMIGDSINIMPILMIGGYLFSNLMALMKMKSVVDQLAKNSPDHYILHITVWFLGQLTAIGALMWKCNRMGLLPTHPSDWLAFRDPIINMHELAGGHAEL